MVVNIRRAGYRPRGPAAGAGGVKFQANRSKNSQVIQARYS